MERPRDLLFGLFAVQLGKVPESRLADFATCLVEASQEPISESSVKRRIMKEEDSALISSLLDESVRACGGKPENAWRSFGGEERIVELFRGEIAFVESGILTTPAQGPASWKLNDRDGLPGVRESVGRYSRSSPHARGGMGQILLAHDEILGRDIAIKELLIGDPQVDDGVAANSPDRGPVPMVARFLQEARITGQLEHPSIVPVYELGHRADGTVYYTMKFVRGSSLAEAIKAAGGLAGRLSLLPHFVDLCQAIAYAHSRGVIHRDIKPENVMVGEFGETVVIDWGLAKVREIEDIHEKGYVSALQDLKLHGSETLAGTAYGSALGTPAYMPPEQARGQIDRIDERSDSYSLAAVLYNLLTGVVPFKSGSVTEVLKKVVRGELKPITLIEPQAPPELVAICTKGLDSNPDKRYESAGAIANEVIRYQSGGRVESYNYRPSELIARFAKRRKGIVSTAVVATAVLLLGAVYSYVQILGERNTAVSASARFEAASEAERAAKEEARLSSYQAGISLAQSLIDDRQFDRANDLLWNLPEEHRAWEWGHLIRGCNLDLATLRGHVGPVRTVRFSPDGERILSAGDDGKAILWSAKTYRLERVLEGHELRLAEARFSPEGSRVLTISYAMEGVGKVWQTDTGDPLLSVGDLAHPVMEGGIFNPDGSVIFTMSPSYEAHAWDAVSGELLHSLAGHGGRVVHMELSPNGRLLVTCGQDGLAKLWNLEHIDFPFTLASHEDTLTHASFSPGGRILATASYDSNICLWDTASGELLRTLRDHEVAVFRVRFGIDESTLVSADAEGTIKVWDVQSGECRYTLEGHSSFVDVLRIIPQTNQAVSASGDGVVKLWDIDTGNLRQTFFGHSGEVHDLAVSPDGTTIATASEDGTVKLWDASSMEDVEPRQYLGHRERILSASVDSSGERLVSVSGRPYGFGSSSLSYDSSIHIWRTDRQTSERTIFGLTSPASIAVLLGDGTRLFIAGDENSASILNLDTMKIEGLFRGHKAHIAGAVVSSDESIVATASLDDTAKVWNLDSREMISSLEGHSDFVWSVALHPTKKIIATASRDGTVGIWDWTTGERLRVLQGHESDVRDVAFNADGSRLVSASSDGTARIWDTDTYGEPVVLRGHSAEVNEAQFGPEGRRIVTISADGTIKIWDAENAVELLTLYRGDSSVTAVDWSSLGKSLYAGFESGQLSDFRAHPWTAMELPGSNGESWRGRYELWKSHINERSLPAREEAPRSRTESILATPYEISMRLKRLVSSATKPEKAGIEFTGTGLRIGDGDVRILLRRFGFRYDDVLVNIAGFPLTNSRELWAGVGNVLKSLDDGQAPIHEIEYIRNGEHRTTRLHVLEPERIEVNINLSMAEATTLLQFGIPIISQNRSIIQSLQQGSVRLLDIPLSGDQLMGLLVAEFTTPDDSAKLMSQMLFEFTSQIGLQKYDRVIKVNGEMLSSIEVLVRHTNKAMEGLNAGQPLLLQLEAIRGSFQLVNIRITARV